jgi:hypothetical protein
MSRSCQNKIDVIHNPPPEGKRPVDSITPRPASKGEVIEYFGKLLREAVPYIEKSTTEPKPGAKRELLAKIQLALDLGIISTEQTMRDRMVKKGL